MFLPSKSPQTSLAVRSTSLYPHMLNNAFLITNINKVCKVLRNLDNFKPPSPYDFSSVVLEMRAP